MAERSISELKKVVIALVENENVKIWKFLKEYLKVKEGVISNSPKSCFREAFSLGFLTEEETVKFLEMTDRRNDTSHTYKEEVAQIIYSKIPEYLLFMKRLLERFMDKI